LFDSELAFSLVLHMFFLPMSGSMVHIVTQSPPLIQSTAIHNFMPDHPVPSMPNSPLVSSLSHFCLQKCLLPFELTFFKRLESSDVRRACNTN
jgi:hypothetical protein